MTPGNQPPEESKAGEKETPASPQDSPLPGQPPGKALTPEEQMALYEDDLKENDWGHQPC